MSEPYDSTQDTLSHIRLVGRYLNQFAHVLVNRGTVHDASKLESPEKELFDRIRPLLDRYAYESPEYKQVVAEMQEGIQHHYLMNSHHPEHYAGGIRGMTLFDIAEMFCDWKAASERRGDVDWFDSVRLSATRFGISDQLLEIFLNTMQEWEREVKV